MATGYLILQLDLDEENPTPFVEIIEQAKEALGDKVESLTHIHAALGEDGLRESYRYLLSETEGGVDG